jgi:hypothetical protein
MDDSPWGKNLTVVASTGALFASKIEGVLNAKARSTIQKGCGSTNVIVPDDMPIGLSEWSG